MIKKTILILTAVASPVIAAEQAPAQSTEPPIIINIYINNQAAVPAPTLAPAPEPQYRNVTHPWDFIVNVWNHYSNYDSEWLTTFTQDRETNYFGRPHASNYSIAVDMANDGRRYSQWHADFLPETFTREVSNEYSPRWQGPMVYDSIIMESDVYETGVRWHHARVRLTVGYTYINQVLKIYALIYKLV
jgi:hypothetical protein